MSQYALNLTLPPVFSADNFFVSGCNREAYQWITAWPEWPAHALLLTGPKGSGKTHLGHIWAGRAEARQWSVTNGQLSEKNNLLIEDIEKIRDERALLHLLNYAKETGQYLLLTSSTPPKGLPFRLPDLTSRLLALPVAVLGQPDDEALGGVLRKQFADRQMKVGEDVIAYLLPRMERSLSKVNELASSLDRQALSEGKSLTIPFVRQWLERAAA